MPNLEEMLMEEQVIKPEGSPAEETQKAKFNMPSFSFLKAQSVDRPIEDYMEHALNFDKKKSTGRIIRGLEGFLGALNYAIIDVIMGMIEKSREKKVGE